MKQSVFALLFAGIFSSVNAQTHTLEKLWETDTVIAIPESVLPDTKKGILYVSLVDGGPWDADGKGGVGILDTKGNVLNNHHHIYIGNIHFITKHTQPFWCV